MEREYHLPVSRFFFVSLCKSDWKGGPRRPRGRSDQRGVSSEWMASAPGPKTSWPPRPWGSPPASKMAPADTATADAQAGQPAWRWERGTSVLCSGQWVPAAPLGAKLSAWLFRSHPQFFLLAPGCAQTARGLGSKWPNTGPGAVLQPLPFPVPGILSIRDLLLCHESSTWDPFPLCAIWFLFGLPDQLLC